MTIFFSNKKFANYGTSSYIPGFPILFQHVLVLACNIEKLGMGPGNEASMEPKLKESLSL